MLAVAVACWAAAAAAAEFRSLRPSALQICVRWRKWIPVVSQQRLRRLQALQDQFSKQVSGRTEFETAIINLARQKQEKSLHQRDANGIDIVTGFAGTGIAQNPQLSLDITADLGLACSTASEMLATKVQSTFGTAVAVQEALRRTLHRTGAGSVPKLNPELQLILIVAVDLVRDSLRGLIRLPHPLSAADRRIVVFCSDADAPGVLEAGATFAGETVLIDKIARGWTEFDQAITTPEFMPRILKLAKILGPRKLMPNTKSGTVVGSLKDALAEFRSGSIIEFRAEHISPSDEDLVAAVAAAAPTAAASEPGRSSVQAPRAVIRATIGSMSSDRRTLAENATALCQEVYKRRPKSEAGREGRIGRNSQPVGGEWPPPKVPLPLEFYKCPDIRRLMVPFRPSRYRGDRGGNTEAVGTSFFVRGFLEAQGLFRLPLSLVSLIELANGQIRGI